jgi:hypothetical protein
MVKRDRACGNDTHWLSHLFALKQLELDVQQLPKGTRGVLSGLHQLQDLTLGSSWDDSARLDVLQGLTPSLTKLKLEDLDSRDYFSISIVPALAGFSALQHLEVLWSYGNGIDCGFLCSMPHVAQLRVLCLEGWLSVGAVHELLTVLPRMTNLVHLDVVSDQLHGGYQL